MCSIMVCRLRLNAFGTVWRAIELTVPWIPDSSCLLWQWVGYWFVKQEASVSFSKVQLNLIFGKTVFNFSRILHIRLTTFSLCVSNKIQRWESGRMTLSPAFPGQVKITNHITMKSPAFVHIVSLTLKGSALLHDTLTFLQVIPYSSALISFKCLRFPAAFVSHRSLSIPGTQWSVLPRGLGVKDPGHSWPLSTVKIFRIKLCN